LFAFSIRRPGELGRGGNGHSGGPVTSVRAFSIFSFFFCSLFFFSIQFSFLFSLLPFVRRLCRRGNANNRRPVAIVTAGDILDHGFQF
jgi:hypothetical protein